MILQTLAGIRAVTSILSLKCRQLCDYALHRLYFKRQAFFKLNTISNNVDNPWVFTFSKVSLFSEISEVVAIMEKAWNFQVARFWKFHLRNNGKRV